MADTSSPASVWVCSSVECFVRETQVTNSEDQYERVRAVKLYLHREFILHLYAEKPFGQSANTGSTIWPVAVYLEGGTDIVNRRPEKPSSTWVQDRIWVYTPEGREKVVLPSLQHGYTGATTISNPRGGTWSIRNYTAIRDLTQGKWVCRLDLAGAWSRKVLAGTFNVRYS